MAAVMKKSTHPRVPPPLTPPLCPLDLPFPWRPPWSNGPLPANGVVASILSYYETRSTRERVATTRFLRLTTLTVRMIFRNVSLC